jgi:RNA polymerase sigma-70 factor (ECF subfamily)
MVLVNIGISQKGTTFCNHRAKHVVTLSSLPDETLLAQIARRDVAAMEALYDRHAQVVYSLVLRIVREETTAEELLQESFWQVWKSATTYDATGPAAAWLYRIARNKALDQLRRVKARPAAVSGEVALSAVGDRPAERASSVEVAAELRWRAEQVRTGLNRLPDEQRVCVELAYYEGLSQSQIAEQLGLPLGTIKTRLRLGVEKLERLLMAAGLQPGDGVPGGMGKDLR